MAALIKSKQRLADHREVFTAEGAIKNRAAFLAERINTIWPTRDYKGK